MTEFPSEVLARRLKDLRKRRGWSLQQLAEECAAAGADRLTENAIENIEHGRRDKGGRRRRDLTVEEWLVLAYVLDVAPIHLLIPIDADESTPYQVVPKGGPSSAIHVRAWIRGLEPIGLVNPKLYFAEVPDEEWTPPADRWTPRTVESMSRGAEQHRYRKSAIGG